MNIVQHGANYKFWVMKNQKIEMVARSDSGIEAAGPVDGNGGGGASGSRWRRVAMDGGIGDGGREAEE